jgi:hypothetical protein
LVHQEGFNYDPLIQITQFWESFETLSECYYYIYNYTDAINPTDVVTSSQSPEPTGSISLSNAFIQSQLFIPVFQPPNPNNAKEQNSSTSAVAVGGVAAAIGYIIYKKRSLDSEKSFDPLEIETVITYVPTQNIFVTQKNPLFNDQDIFDDDPFNDGVDDDITSDYN